MSTLQKSRSSLSEWLSHAGFMVPTLVFSLRTGAAAVVALAVGYALGLEHPHWAAMSAWACAQPTREHLLSRGGYRVGGSVVGVAYAVLLVLIAQNSLFILALGLALWVAVCAFVGNLQRGYLSYGCMLAGYSASMVVLLHHGPSNEIWLLAGDRMATVLTGVVCALAISWFFAPRRKPAAVIGQSRRALALVLEACAGRLRDAPVREAWRLPHLQSELARAEELLELYVEGSRTARRTAQALHRVQFQALELVFQMAQWELEARGSHSSAVEASEHALQVEGLAPSLDALCSALRQPPGTDALGVQRLHAALGEAQAAVRARVAAAAPDAPQARSLLLTTLDTLQALLEALRDSVEVEQLDLSRHTRTRTSMEPTTRVVPRTPLHRDWVGARQAAIRAGSVVLALGMVWAATGSQLVSFGMLGLSVMLLVFSGFENPQRTMAFVLRGQLLGATLALLCQALVWPLATSGWMLVAMVLPFQLVASLLFAHRRTAAGGLDLNMVLYILLAPVFPFHWDPVHGVGMAVALVSGPAIAWLVYGLIFPTNARRRMVNVTHALVQEVPALAQRLLNGPGTPAPDVRTEMPAAPLPTSQVSQEASMLQHHRMLQLVRWADKAQAPERDQLARLGVAVRFVETTMVELEAWRTHTDSTLSAQRRAARQIRVTLRHMARWNPAEAPATTVRRLAHAWEKLAHQTALPPELGAKAHRVAHSYLPTLRPVA